MSKPVVEDAATEVLVGQIAGEFTDRLNRDERPDVEDYVGRHPQIGDILRQVLSHLHVMRRSATSTGSSLDRWVEYDNVPETLGEYRIVREVGRGGMGIVYEALQEALGRRVALKVLPTHPLMEKKFLERFRREACVAAGLHHTNIVPVFGIGEHHGVHYYAMQFIEGQGLDKVLADIRQRQGALPVEGKAKRGGAESRQRVMNDVGDQQPDPRPSESAALAHNSDLCAIWSNHSRYFQTVARIALQVADALAYAHRQGVLHRDIKPSNLLLDDHGLIWVTDLGLAKTDSSSNLTQLGDVVGTLRYMAPERFAGRSNERSDIYSLGLTLYEMLTLRSAFDDTDRGRLIKRITQDEPIPPRKHDARIPRDLETIVLKAISKESADRYESAEELAGELQLFLADRPIAARRATVPERVWRWCRRNRTMAALTAGVALLLICVAVAAAGAAWLWRSERDVAVENMRRAVRAEQNATEVTQLATRHLYESLLARARAGRWSGRAGRRSDGLAAIADAAKLLPELSLDEITRRELSSEAIACMTLVDLHIDRRWPVGGHRNAHPRIGFDAEVERYATVEPNDQIIIRRMTDNAELVRLLSPHSTNGRPFLRFSSDGEHLAAKLVADSNAQVIVWNLNSREIVFEAAAGGEWFYKDLDFSPDGKFLAFTGPDRAVYLQKLRNGQEHMRIPLGLAPYHFSFRPDGRQLAVALSRGENDPATVVLVDLESGNVVHSMGHAMHVSAVAWSQDGKQLATACYDYNVYVWDTVSGQQLRVCEGHRSKVIHVAFNHAGDLLASAAWDMTTRVWDARSGEQLVQTDLWATQFSRDDRWLAFDVPGVVVGRWEVAADRECRVLVGHAKDSAVVGIAFAHDGVPGASPVGGGRVLASASRYDGIRLWDSTSGRELGHLTAGAGARNVTFEPSGNHLITAGSGILRWPIVLHRDDGSSKIRVGPHVTISKRGNSAVALDANGNTLIAGALTDQFFILNPDRPEDKVVLAQAGHPDWFAAISPNGTWAALGRKQPPGVARVWSTRTGELAAELSAGGGSLVTFSPDGRWLVVSTNGELAFYEAGTWREVRRIKLDGPGFTQVAFSPDMRLMAITSAFQVALLDPETGAEVVTLHPPREAQLSASYPEGASGICFGPDGSQLAVGSTDGLIFLWDLRQIRKQLAQIDLDWHYPAYPAQLAASEVDLTPVEIVRRYATESPDAAQAAIEVATQPARPALQFDGVDDFVSVPTFPLGGELTIEAWVKSPDVRANYARILDFGYGRSSNNIILGWQADSGRILWEIYNGGSSRNLRIVTPEVFPQGRWVHVAAVVQANGDGSVYWDGNSVATGRLQVPETASRSAQYIGRSNWRENAMFSGLLAEVRIWSTARSPAAIQADMNRVLGGDEPDLIAYWRLDDGSGTIAADSTARRRHVRLQGGTWQP